MGTKLNYQFFFGYIFFWGSCENEEEELFYAHNQLFMVGGKGNCSKATTKVLPMKNGDLMRLYRVSTKHGDQIGVRAIKYRSISDWI